jgi:FkbM family methyltransferase
MTAARTLRMADGVEVVVPDSLDLITPYVLQEQQDWFEDEIRFLRRALRAGQHALDIGANYGVYTLSIARTVGPSGSVLAFEPASATARMLAQSVAANGFSQVRLEQAALSSAPGQAQLSLQGQAELNTLARGAGGGPTETVRVTTLDEVLARHTGPGIDFVKIDAEGEEANILRGGARFLREQSPLVQYEIRADAEMHLELAEQFAAIGYRSFRLVPALDLLVPFDPAEQADEYLLNLFACKADRAGSLEAEGRLLASMPDPLRGAAPGGQGPVEAAIALHAMSRDPALAPTRRFAALLGSLDLLRAVCSQGASALRLASLARAAQDAGERALAVAALGEIAQGLQQGRPLGGQEPFLAPSPRFEQIPISGAPGHWLMAAVLEEYERLVSFSSFYTGAAALPRLETIAQLGLGSPEMARRLQLVRARYGPRPPAA